MCNAYVIMCNACVILHWSTGLPYRPSMKNSFHKEGLYPISGDIEQRRCTLCKSNQVAEVFYKLLRPHFLELLITVIQ
jgi:hypothetical protein